MLILDHLPKGEEDTLFSSCNFLNSSVCWSVGQRTRGEMDMGSSCHLRCLDPFTTCEVVPLFLFLLLLLFIFLLLLPQSWGPRDYGTFLLNVLGRV